METIIIGVVALFVGFYIGRADWNNANIELEESRDWWRKDARKVAGMIQERDIRLLVLQARLDAVVKAANGEK